jgi:hypothetical protein
MSATTASPPRPQTALEICGRYEPSKEVRTCLRAGDTPKALFDRLVEQRLHADAAALLARLLTKEEAVWWGCLCAWYSARPNPTPFAQAALQATLRWLQEPTEEHRRAAEQQARKAGAHTPAGAVAQAAAFAAGSMSLAGLPEVAPPEDLTAQTIAGAVRACAAELAVAEGGDAYRQLLRFGLEVASGKNRWL